MALPLLGWNVAGTCDVCDCYGGVVKTSLFDFCLITDVAIDNATRSITGFTLSALASPTVYTHDNDNDTSFYNQTGERVNNRCHKFVQEILGEFYCLNATTSEEANGLSKTNAQIAIHELENGTKLVQGIDLYEDPLNPGTYLWKRSKKPALTVIDIISGTGAELPLVRLKVNSEGRCASPVTTMTDVQIAAL